MVRADIPRAGGLGGEALTFQLGSQRDAHAVRDDDMRVLDLLDQIARHVYAQIDEVGAPPSAATGQRDRPSASDACRLRRQQYVGRVSAGADQDHKIAGTHQRRKLLGEHAVETGVVAPGGDERHVIGERDCAKGWLLTAAHAFRQIADKMGGGGGTASVADQEDHATTLMAIEQRFGYPANRVVWHGVGQFGDLVPVAFNVVLYHDRWFLSTLGLMHPRRHAAKSRDMADYRSIRVLHNFPRTGLLQPETHLVQTFT